MTDPTETAATPPAPEAPLLTTGPTPTPAAVTAKPVEGEPLPSGTRKSVFEAMNTTGTRKLSEIQALPYNGGETGEPSEVH